MRTWACYPYVRQNEAMMLACTTTSLAMLLIWVHCLPFWASHAYVILSRVSGSEQPLLLAKAHYIYIECPPGTVLSLHFSSSDNTITLNYHTKLGDSQQICRGFVLTNKARIKILAGLLPCVTNSWRAVCPLRTKVGINVTVMMSSKTIEYLPSHLIHGTWKWPSVCVPE